MVRPKGLEPLAHCLEGSCSIHLSYGRILDNPSELRILYYYIVGVKVKGFINFLERFAAGAVLAD